MHNEGLSSSRSVQYLCGLLGHTSLTAYLTAYFPFCFLCVALHPKREMVSTQDNALNDLHTPYSHQKNKRLPGYLLFFVLLKF